MSDVAIIKKAKCDVILDGSNLKPKIKCVYVSEQHKRGISEDFEALRMLKYTVRCWRHTHTKRRWLNKKTKKLR